MSVKERAIKNFTGKLNCSQSVISEYSDVLGLDDKTARAISAGFGGGIASTQKT